MGKVGGNVTYDAGNRNVGSGQERKRCIVVDVAGDPLKAGRVKVRVIGDWDNEQDIPDSDLPWVKVSLGTGVAGMQTMTSTNGLLPGTLCYLDGFGGGGTPDYTITDVIPTDRKDSEQTMHPSTQGKEATDTCHTDEDRKNQKYACDRQLRRVVESNTTMEAWQNARKMGKKDKRTAEPVAESRDKVEVPPKYGNRKRSRDAENNGATIAADLFDGNKDAQQYTQDQTGGKSEILPNAIPSIQSLKKIQDNPDSIQSIMPSNYGALMGQISSWFGGGFQGNASGQQKQEKEANTDCNFLINTANNFLSEEQLEQKEICLEARRQETDEAGGVPLVTDFGEEVEVQSGETEFDDTQSGLSLTLGLLANNIGETSLETTYASNNFTHDANDSVINWHSNAISNAAYVTHYSNGHVAYANSIAVTQSVTFPSYTVVGAPSAAIPGQMIYVSNESGGAVMAFSNGTNWLRCTDRTVIS